MGSEAQREPEDLLGAGHVSHRPSPLGPALELTASSGPCVAAELSFQALEHTNYKR